MNNCNWFLLPKLKKSSAIQKISVTLSSVNISDIF